jgi:hypothetical protein
MNLLKKLIDLIRKEHSYIKDLFIILIITRLMFLEDNTLILLAEIVGGLVLIFNPTSRKEISEE